MMMSRRAFEHPIAQVNEFRWYPPHGVTSLIICGLHMRMIEPSPIQSLPESTRCAPLDSWDASQSHSPCTGR